MEKNLNSSDNNTTIQIIDNFIDNFSDVISPDTELKLKVLKMHLKGYDTKKKLKLNYQIC